MFNDWEVSKYFMKSMNGDGQWLVKTVTVNSVI